MCQNLFPGSLKSKCIVIVAANGRRRQVEKVMRGLRPVASVTDDNEKQEGKVWLIKAIKDDFPSLFYVDQFRHILNTVLISMQKDDCAHRLATDLHLGLWNARREATTAIWIVTCQLNETEEITRIWTGGHLWANGILSSFVWLRVRYPPCSTHVYRSARRGGKMTEIEKQF